MLPLEPYNDIVRTLFFSPVHAGKLTKDYALNLVATADESAQGSQVILCAGIDDGVIAQMRFQVWGCPHLIAAAEGLCQEKEQNTAAGLSVFAVSQIMEQLNVPVEKTGRILLLEDALKSLMAQYSGADGPGKRT